MDLISREAAIEAVRIPNGAYDPLDRHGIIIARVEACRRIRELSSVEAVPMDKLCLLLHDIAGSPCYTQPGEDMCNQLIGDQCNTEWDDVECWKQFLTKWMEAQGNG